MSYRVLTALIAGLILVSSLVASEPAVSLSPAVDRVARSWYTEDGLPQDSVNAIVHARDGFLWVGTSAGLARFDGVQFRKFGLQDGLRSVYITALAEDREGALWIGTSGGGVSRWNAGHITSFGVEEGFPLGLEVVSLAADGDGSMWIGTDKGLAHWTGGTFKIIGDAEGLPQKQVRALLKDSHGNLWVSVLLEGVFRGTGGKFTRLEHSEAKPGGVYVLYEDHDGTIWAGSDSLWIWSGESWQSDTSRVGLPKAVIQSIAETGGGSLWVGTRTQGLYRSEGGQFERVANDGPLATQSVRAVIADRDGSVWAGIVAGGLHRLAPRVLQYWGANAGLASGAVASIVEDVSGALWIGTTNQGILRFEDGRFNPVEDPAISERPIIYCATSTSDGAIWAAGEQCLYRFQPGQPSKAFLDGPARAEAFRAVCADGETLWLGSYASTLLKCDAEGLHVVARAGLFPGTITSMVREAAGTLWIGTSGGLHRWTAEGVRTWTRRDGLLTDSIRSLYRDPDGVLWIGTLGGGLSRMKDGRFVNITTQQGLVDDVISQIVPDDFGALWLGCNRGLMRIERRDIDALADGRISELYPIVLGRNEGMVKEQCFGGTSPTVLKTRDGRLCFPTTSGFAEIDPRRFHEFAPSAPRATIEEIRVDQQPRDVTASIVIPPGHRRLEVNYTAPVLRGGEWLRFRHRLEGLDHDWVSAGSRRLASYDGLSPGRYLFRIAVADGKGAWNESDVGIAVIVQPFLWQTLWFRAGTILLLVLACTAAVWWHLHRTHRLQIAALERERKQQAELARVSRVSLLGELSASLAHELNQPLSAILSNAQAAQRFIADGAIEVSELRPVLQDIVQADRRASEIIRRMRAMMQKGEAQLEPRDINTDIEQVLVLIHSELTARNVSVSTQLMPELPPVSGDHIQLQQVLLNLIFNGCDSMHDMPPEERRLLISTEHAGDGMVRVSVSDQGIGLDPAVLKQMFTAFYSTKTHGLGMGLSICRAIIKAHGGLLWAENNSADRGATFHFTLRLGDGASIAQTK